jgi:zinc finger protein
VYDELYGRVYSSSSDSRTTEERTRWEGFLKKLTMAREGKLPFTLILDDPLAASYLQNPYAPEENPQMTIETYERTEEQNEDYGLNDIRISGYEADEAQAEQDRTASAPQEGELVVEEGEVPVPPEGAPAA